MTEEHEHADVRERLKTALINAHALESQGLAVLDKQLSSLDDDTLGPVVADGRALLKGHI